MAGSRSRQRVSGSVGPVRGGLRRRDFLRLAAAGAAACAWPGLAFPGRAWADGPDPLAGITVVDIHAHPDADLGDRVARTADLAPAGISAACYAAVGDSMWSSGRSTRTEYENVKEKLTGVLKGPVARGEVGLVRTVADIPGPGAALPGAILAIEGGDPLEGKVERVDEFYALGVRIITLVHYRNNELGDIMFARPNSAYPGTQRHGLSDFGRAVVAHMETLGMLVDVAHTSAETLRDVLAVAKKPVVDSHTGPCHRDSASEAERCGRRRTWEELEWVAKAGGLVGSWVSSGRSEPKDFAGWAKDILEMRDRLGPQAVCLGTDSGGHLPVYVQGYQSWRDLRQLAAALTAAGMPHDDLAAFFGGNALRVLRQCLG